MSRPRGNKTSKATREQRRSSVVEVLKENPAIKQGDLADVTGVSLATVKRDLAELRERFSLVTDAKYEEFKKAQLAVFELIEKNLVEGEIPPDVAREWRGIRSEISQLLGLNEPSRSISARVSANALPNYGPAAHPELWQLHEACVDLNPDQVVEVVRFAKSIRRTAVPGTGYQLPAWMGGETVNED